MYEGRVYDGPWEGRMLKHERSYFPISFTEAVSVREFTPHAMAMMPEIRQVYYRWSNPLRAWVFEWPSEPLRKKAVND